MMNITDIIYLIAVISFIIVVVVNEISISRRIVQLVERIEFLEDKVAFFNEVYKNILDYLTRRINESTRND